MTPKRWQLTTWIVLKANGEHREVKTRARAREWAKQLKGATVKRVHSIEIPQNSKRGR